MISAIILAAGSSTRMGSPKMLLPWGDNTIIGQVIETLKYAGIHEILVVTGSDRIAVQHAIEHYDVKTVFNSLYKEGDMLISIQTGLRNLRNNISAALIVLGDQPQLKSSVVTRITKAYNESLSPLIVPSFEMRRGHPWIIERSLWQRFLQMKPDQKPRDFLNKFSQKIYYIPLEDDSILRDIDTQQEYKKELSKLN